MTDLAEKLDAALAGKHGWVIDSREQSPLLKSRAAATMLLEKPNPADPDHPRSYDLHIRNAAGTDIEIERKKGLDLLNSHADGYLYSQCSRVDCLLIEWSDMDLALRRLPPDFAKASLSALKAAAKIAIGGRVPILFSRSEEDTADILDYLAKQTDEPNFDNRIKVTGNTAIERLFASLPGINIDYTLKDGRRRFDAIKGTMRPEQLILGLGVDRWNSEAGVPNATAQKIMKVIREA